MAHAPISTDVLAAEPELRRALGPWHLIALGIGAIIGAGIFVITGHAAATYSGPGVVISFAIAGLGCLFAGLCYGEYASMIPVAGSAYTYTYATLGRWEFYGEVINLFNERNYLERQRLDAPGLLGGPIDHSQNVYAQFERLPTFGIRVTF